MNNIAKNNINNKKYSELRDKIASGIDLLDKKEENKKTLKRRTKEERTATASVLESADKSQKKQIKYNYSINVNLSPKRNVIDNLKGS